MPRTWLHGPPHAGLPPHPGCAGGAQREEKARRAWKGASQRAGVAATLPPASLCFDGSGNFHSLEWVVWLVFSFFSKTFVLCWFPKFARKRSFLLENSSSVAANQKGKGFFSTRASGRRGEPRPAAATCLRTAKSQVGRKPARSAGPSSFSPGLALLLECSAGVSSNPNCPIHSSR